MDEFKHMSPEDMENITTVILYLTDVVEQQPSTPRDGTVEYELDKLEVEGVRLGKYN